jgi:hypothetical protein
MVVSCIESNRVAHWRVPCRQGRCGITPRLGSSQPMLREQPPVITGKRERELRLPRWGGNTNVSRTGLTDDHSGGHSAGQHRPTVRRPRRPTHLFTCGYRRSNGGRGTPCMPRPTPHARRAGGAKGAWHASGIRAYDQERSAPLAGRRASARHASAGVLRAIPRRSLQWFCAVTRHPSRRPRQPPTVSSTNRSVGSFDTTVPSGTMTNESRSAANETS